MTSFFVTRVKAFVGDAEQADDLMGILRRILNLDEIKDLIENKLEKMEHEETKQVCIESIPLDYIISNDAIQSILSYIPHQNTVALVNKNFSALFQKNKLIRSAHEVHKEVDWTSVVQGKQEEIERISKMRDDELKSLKTKYDDIIQRFEDDLQATKDPILKQQEQDKPSHLYCRVCFDKVPSKDIFECAAGDWNYHRCRYNNKQCRKCMQECIGNDECGALYCQDCKFTKQQCGATLCDNCSDYHYKHCGCWEN